MLHEVGRAGRDGALCPRCQSDGKQGDTWTSWRDAAADSKLPPGELSSAVLRLQLGLRSWGGTSPHDWGLWRGAEQTLAPAVGRKRGEEQREKRQASLQLPPVPTGCMAPGAWHVGEGRGGPTVPVRHPSRTALRERMQYRRTALAASPFSPPLPPVHGSFSLQKASVRHYRRVGGYFP